jgi:hypothetical protein
MGIKGGYHIFRATSITTYLKSGGKFENTQAKSRTTKFHDRAGEEITFDEVEQIKI